MSLSVIAKGAKAPMNSPVYGNLVHTENLQFAYRATSSLNNLDLSNNEFELIKVGNPKINNNGLLSVEETSGYQIANPSLFHNRFFDSYTMMGVLSAQNLAGESSETANCCLLNDYINTTPSSGLFISATGGNLVFRTVFAGTNVNDNQQVGNYLASLELPSDILVDNGDGTFNLKPSFFAMSISTEPSLNKGSNITAIVSHPDFYTVGVGHIYNNGYSLTSLSHDFSASSKSAFATNPFAPMHVGNYTTGGFDRDRSQQVKEARFDSQFFTLDMMNAQYQATKKWLLAEGVLDISHWR